MDVHGPPSSVHPSFIVHLAWDAHPSFLTPKNQSVRVASSSFLSGQLISEIEGYIDGYGKSVSSSVGRRMLDSGRFIPRVYKLFKVRTAVRSQQSSTINPSELSGWRWQKCLRGVNEYLYERVYLSKSRFLLQTKLISYFNPPKKTSYIFCVAL